jgi:DNA-binding MarR family transcriptional regulator
VWTELADDPLTDKAFRDPGADRTCTEAYASSCRTGEALLGELDRRVRLTFGIPQAAATALAVIDGAGTPLTPSQVSDRVLIASATMTATLDLLEHRGWIRRIPNPDDRRSTLIEITPDGRAAAEAATDQPGPLTGQRIRPARLGARPATFLAGHKRRTP